MSNFTLPYDPTGISPANRVTVAEVHNLEPSAFTPSSYFIVPRLAPFFMNNITMVDHLTNRPLHLGVDWYFTHRFIDAEEKLQTSVYGSISFYQIPSMPSVVRITSYQSLGGNFTLDTAGLLEMLANTEYNPRLANWEQVVDVPEAVPVIQHGHNVETDTGSYFAMISALDSIAEAIRYMTGETLPSLEQLGLGNIHNYPLATVDDLINGGTVETYVNATILVSAINIALSTLDIPELGINGNQAFPGNLGEATRLTVIGHSNTLTALNDSLVEARNAINVINGSVPYYTDGAASPTASALPNASLAIRSGAIADSVPIRRTGKDILAETVTTEPKSLVNIETLNEALDAILGQGNNPIAAIQNLQARMTDVEDALEEQIITNGTLNDAIDAVANALGNTQLALTQALMRVTALETSPNVKRQALGNISGARTVDFGLGSHAIGTVTGNLALTFTLPANFVPATDLIVVQLRLTMNASYTITHPTNTILPNGVAPAFVGGKTYLLSYIKAGTENWRLAEPTVWNS